MVNGRRKMPTHYAFIIFNVVKIRKKQPHHFQHNFPVFFVEAHSLFIFALFERRIANVFTLAKRKLYPKNPRHNTITDHAIY